MAARSMELRAIREKMMESPPPPPPNTSIREWFAGLALGCGELMRGVPPEQRAAEAVRLADELITALMTPRVPTRESMAGPTAAELKSWEEHIMSARTKKELQNRETMPAIKRVEIAPRRPTVRFEAILPPPSDSRGRPTVPPSLPRASNPLLSGTAYSLSRADLERVNG